jgi:hypothetical protein
MPVTPNIGLNTPIIGSNQWGQPLNYNFSQLDLFLSGQIPIPGLAVDGDVSVTGTITAGAFSGLDGAVFLTSALFDVPNGIPQLNGAGIIPAALLPTQGIDTVAFSPTPTFNAADGAGFKITLTGDVTSSTFANGTEGPALVVFRIVQDGAGGHAFTWPSNVRNGGSVNPGANARSIQIFTVDSDGSLDAATPMMYS